LPSDCTLNKKLQVLKRRVDAKYDECHAHAVDKVGINLKGSQERLSETGQAIAKPAVDAVMLPNDS